MVETAFCMGPEPRKRRCARAMIRCAVCLEIINTHFRSGMEIPSRFRPDLLNITSAALGLATEKFVPAFRRLLVETAFRWCRRGNRHLIEVERRQFCRDQIVRAPHVSKARLRCDGKLRRIIQPWIEERALTMHLENCHEGIPVRNRAPASPRVKIDS